MAVTQYQQYLADKAQTPNDPEECCLSMGGDLVTDSDGTPLCSFTDFEYPLSLACGYAQQAAETAPDANTQQSGGGFGAWLSSNLETIGTIATTIISGGPQQTSPGPQDNTGDEDGKKTLIAVAVAIFVVVVAIVLIRKSRK